MGLDAEIAIAGHGVANDTDLRRLSYELIATVGRTPFWLDPATNRHTLSFCERSYWDIPDGSIEVSLGGRYYGPTYERGHWPDLAAVIRFFRLRMPKASIYYGSDSGGPVPFSVEDEEAMWDHWAKSAGGTYGLYMGRREGSTMPVPLCTFCNEAMIRNGSNLADTFGAFYCYCGASVDTHDGGQTWTDRKGNPVTVTDFATVAAASNDGD